MSAPARRLPIPWDRAVALHFLGPALVWSAHFLLVYVYVSLACLWGWHEPGQILGPVRIGVAALTALAGLLILWLGWRSRRDQETGTRRGFLAWMGVLSSGLFLGATLFVGLPSLLAAPCH